MIHHLKPLRSDELNCYDWRGKGIRAKSLPR
jgi:hypothetical protein